MQNDKERSKDAWDKTAAITPLLLGILVTGGAAVFGVIHNSKQDKLAEITALVKLQPMLTAQNAIDREFGYAAFAALGYEEVALRLIRLRKDSEAEAFVTSIKQNNSSLAPEADATLKELRKAEAPDALASRRSALISQLFAETAARRGAAYASLIASWAKDPSIVPELIEYARKNTSNANGIYNTLVLLSHMDREALRPHVAEIKQFSQDMESIGPKIQERATVLRSRLPTSG
jgi:hypothetical protein